MKRVILRLANESDSESLLSWRNNPESRRMFRNSSIVSYESHHNWFMNALDSKLIQILVAIDEERNRIGVVRVDFNKDLTEGEVSINLNPNFRGMGLGLAVLKSCSNYVKKNFVVCKKLVAQVKKSNQKSNNIFLKAGYELEREEKQYFSYFYAIQ